MKKKPREKLVFDKTTYAVIKFVDCSSKLFETIPELWFINEEKTACYWPPKSGQSFTLRAMNQDTPDWDWEVYECEVVSEGHASYSIGASIVREKCSQNYNTSSAEEHIESAKFRREHPGLIHKGEKSFENLFAKVNSAKTKDDNKASKKPNQQNQGKPTDNENIVSINISLDSPCETQNNNENDLSHSFEHRSDLEPCSQNSVINHSENKSSDSKTMPHIHSTDASVARNHSRLSSRNHPESVNSVHSDSNYSGRESQYSKSGERCASNTGSHRSTSSFRSHSNSKMKGASCSLNVSYSRSSVHSRNSKLKYDHPSNQLECSSGKTQSGQRTRSTSIRRTRSRSSQRNRSGSSHRNRTGSNQRSRSSSRQRSRSSSRQRSRTSSRQITRSRLNQRSRSSSRQRSRSSSRQRSRSRSRQRSRLRSRQRSRSSSNQRARFGSRRRSCSRSNFGTHSVSRSVSRLGVVSVRSSSSVSVFSYKSISPANRQNNSNVQLSRGFNERSQRKCTSGVGNREFSSSTFERGIPNIRCLIKHQKNSASRQNVPLSSSSTRQPMHQSRPSADQPIQENRNLLPTDQLLKALINNVDQLTKTINKNQRRIIENDRRFARMEVTINKSFVLIGDLTNALETRMSLGQLSREVPREIPRGYHLPKTPITHLRELTILNRDFKNKEFFLFMVNDQKQYCTPSKATDTVIMTAFLKRFISVRVRASIVLKDLKGQEGLTLYADFRRVYDFIIEVMKAGYLVRNKVLTNNDVHSVLRVVWGRSKQLLNDEKKSTSRR